MDPIIETHEKGEGNQYQVQQNHTRDHKLSSYPCDHQILKLVEERAGIHPRKVSSPCNIPLNVRN